MLSPLTSLAASQKHHLRSQQLKKRKMKQLPQWKRRRKKKQKKLQSRSNPKSQIYLLKKRGDIFISPFFNYCSLSSPVQSVPI